MTKQHPPLAAAYPALAAAYPAIAVSPSLSLRQAVRPLMFAHALLVREQGLSAQLMEECDNLKRVTREALEAAAMVHLLAPDRLDGTAGEVEISRRDQLIKAYARAATTWAEVTGTAIALADALLNADRLDDVHRLAGFLEAAGEPTAAQDLRARANMAAKRALEARLRHIHVNMTVPEIAGAIEALRESTDETAASFHIRDLARAMVKLLYASPQEKYLYSFGQAAWRVTWLVSPGNTVSRGTLMFRMRYAAAPQEYDGGKISFPAIVSKLLVTGDREVTGDIALALVIRIPGPIATELHKKQPDTREIFSRLDALARTFWKLQTESPRSPSPQSW